MDIEKILTEVRAALAQMEPTGGGGGLLFFNMKNEHISAELHIRDGKLAELIVTSAEELRIRKACHLAHKDEV